MDINSFRGLVTAVLLVLFVALMIWVFAGRSRGAFDEAARLPFDDEEDGPGRSTTGRRPGEK